MKNSYINNFKRSDAVEAHAAATMAAETNARGFDNVFEMADESADR